MTHKKQELTMEKQQSRRDFIKKSAYAAPVVFSFSAMPAMATSGSAYEDDDPYAIV